MAFAAATDAIFADPNVSEMATWRPGGIGGVAVRVIRRRPDAVIEFGGSRGLLPTMLIDVRKSDIAEPDEGDTVLIGGETFRILAPPNIDALGLVFTCESAKV